MDNFTFHNPTKIIFGRGSIAELGACIPRERRVLLTCGGGSIKANGVYDQVMAALRQHTVLEFNGIEPNPTYETLMRAVAVCRTQKIDFLLSVGGGSVLDGTKFIAAAVPFTTGEPWDILARNATVTAALPLGAVLTLPATGSEMNCVAVVSRAATQEKLAFFSPLVHPVFSILDPETTFSLPARQISNGIVDPFVHVTEQYLTYPVGGALQDRQAEAILLALRDVGPQALAQPRDYDARATIMWCCTQALNGTLLCGVPQDWATHMIGHELTARFGVDHAQSLAIVLPGVLRHKRETKMAKLAQYGRRVWDLAGDDPQVADQAIDATESFFIRVGMRTRLHDYNIGTDQVADMARSIVQHSGMLGERRDIGEADIVAILQSRA